MSLPRDCSPCFDGDVCRICGQPRSPEGFDNHTARHLATGEACAQLDYRVEPHVWRVVPTSTVAGTEYASLWESDGDTPILRGPNADALRDAILKGRELNRQTKRKIAAAKRGMA